MTYDKPLKVGKRERYELTGSNLTAWLAGEALLSATVTPNSTYATLFQPADISGSTIGFMLDGVAAGRCKIHIEYATATRSDCVTKFVIVQNC